jgi:hypothetical protein
MEKKVISLSSGLLRTFLTLLKFNKKSVKNNNSVSLTIIFKKKLHYDKNYQGAK